MFYIGVTSHLFGRVYQHKIKEVSGFTSRYNVTKLVYYEEYNDIYQAIRREKQLKNWHRQWKINLVKKSNLHFKDLAKDWYSKKPSPRRINLKKRRS